MCSGSSGGSGGRENSGGSGVGIPLAVPTPSPPSLGQGELQSSIPIRDTTCFLSNAISVQMSLDQRQLFKLK